MVGDNLAAMSLRHRHRLLLSLAFAGSLLLALVPSLGRLHQAFAQDPLASQLGQFCSSDGLVARAELSRWLAGDAGDPAPRAPADDCDYCPLLVAPALPVAGLPVPPAQPLPQARTALRVQPRLPQRHLIGWAPRGPPVSNAG